MVTTLSDLARLVAGHVVGDGSCILVGANALNAAGPADITLLDSPDKAHLLARCSAAAVLLSRDFQQADRPAIQVDDVHAAFAKIVNFFRPAVVTSNVGVSVKAVVSATAEIASTAQVHPGATIGANVEIGANSIITAARMSWPAPASAKTSLFFPAPSCTKTHASALAASFTRAQSWEHTDSVTSWLMAGTCCPHS